MSDKGKIYILLGSIAVIFISIIGYTFSYFSATVTVDNQTETAIKSNKLGLEFTGISDINISNIIPGDYMTKTFTVKNTSSHAVDFNIYMDGVVNGFNEDLVYTLTDDKGIVVEQTVLPSTTTVNEKKYLKTGIALDLDETKSYTMTIKFLYSEFDQNALQGASFIGTLGVDTEAI